MFDSIINTKIMNYLPTYIIIIFTKMLYPSLIARFNALEKNANKKNTFNQYFPFCVLKKY